MESESSQTIATSTKYSVATEIHQEQYRLKNRASNQPSKRWGHTCVLYRHYLYLFGGNISSNYHQNSNSLYSFDLKNWGDTCWDRYLPGENEVCPSLRDSHSATVIDHTMYVVCGQQNDVPNNEIYAFDLRSQTCSLSESDQKGLRRGIFQNKEDAVQQFIVYSTKEDRWTFFKEVRGEDPGLLESHSFVRWEGSPIEPQQPGVHVEEFILFGGIKSPEQDSDNGKTSNEMFLLRVEGNTLDNLIATWTKLAFPVPLPHLHSHICLFFKKKYLLLIGGDRSLEDAANEEQGPSEEHGKDFSCLIYRVHMTKRAVSILPVTTNDFKPRIAHSGIVEGDSIYVFGGLEKCKNFNGQLLKMTVKKIASGDNESGSDPVHNPREGVTVCKHCPFRTQNLTNKQSPSKPPLTLVDYSTLENKIKRRLMFAYYHPSPHMENSLLYLMTMIRFVGNQTFSPPNPPNAADGEAQQMLEEHLQPELRGYVGEQPVDKDKYQPMVEIVTTRINYPIPAFYDEYRMEEDKNTFEIFEFSRTGQKSNQHSPSTSESSGDEGEQDKLKKSRSVASGIPMKQKGSPSPGAVGFDGAGQSSVSMLGKRLDSQGLTSEGKNNGQKGNQGQPSSILPRIQSNQSGIIESYKQYSEQLSKHYMHKQRKIRTITRLSFPDDTFLVKDLISDLEKGMVTIPETGKKNFSPIYQELSVVMRMGSECLVVYRDYTDQVLFVYFKRLRDEPLDTKGHLFSLIQLQLKDLIGRTKEDLPLKLRLLLSDVSLYIGLDMIQMALEQQGQHRHYFIFKPNYIRGQEAKPSCAYDPEKKEFIVNYLASPRVSEQANSPVVSSSVCALGFIGLFDFDMTRTLSTYQHKIGFKEAYVEILRNPDKGTDFPVSPLNETSYFSNYSSDHKLYSEFLEQIINTLKHHNTYLNLKSNILVFSVDLMVDLMNQFKQVPSYWHRVEEWYDFKKLANKALIYSQVDPANNIMRLTNVLDLSPKFIDAVLSEAPNMTLPLLAFTNFCSQDEYIDMMKNFIDDNWPSKYPKEPAHRVAAPVYSTLYSN